MQFHFVYISHVPSSTISQGRRMVQDSCHEAHDCLHAHSYKNLEKARWAAAVKKGYDYTTTHTEVWQLFRQWFGQDPYKWQIDVTEAILLELDSVVIAGTGAGKMMPLLLQLAQKVIIVSPLKILQADQVHAVLFL